MRGVVWVLVGVLLVSGCSGGAISDVQSESVSSTSTTKPVNTSTTSVVLEGLDRIVADHHGGGRGAVIVGVFERDSAVLAAAGVDADGRPMTPERPWPTASLAKVFTATAVMQLVESGVVDLDAPVADYVDFPIWDQIVVRDLLSHRSPIPTVASFTIRCPTEGSFDAIKKVVADIAQTTEPGVKSAYSNTNYLVLGMLIESVTGRDAGHSMKETIFEPLGMDSTYWYESQSGPSPWWKSPEAQQGVGLNDCGELGRTFGTDGAAITSAADMDRFYRGLFGGELMGSETLESMLEMDSELFGFRYGLGLLEMVRPSASDDVLYGFGGSGNMAYATAAFYDPTRDRTVTVFTTRGDQVSLLWEAIVWANEQDG